MKVFSESFVKVFVIFCFVLFVEKFKSLKIYMKL